MWGMSRRLRAATVLAIVAVMGLTSAAVVGDLKADPPTIAAARVSTPATTAAPALPAPLPTTTPDPQLAAAPVGALLQEAMPAPAQRDAVAGVIIDVGWNALQPTSGDALAASNPIDSALAAVQQSNATDPGHPLGLVVRLLGGIDAPAWAKQAGGAPLFAADQLDGATGTIGRYWTADYGAAYASLQRQLADRYDGAPGLLWTSMARCTVSYSQPFARHLDPATLHTLLAAGFSENADQECLRDQVDAHQVWQRTRSVLDLSPYADVTGTTPFTGEQITAGVASYCRQQLGARCVLEADGLHFPAARGDWGELYLHMFELGAPLTFGVAAPDKVGNLQAAMSFASLLGATTVEVPGAAGLPASQLNQLRALLRPA